MKKLCYVFVLLWGNLFAQNILVETQDFASLPGSPIPKISPNLWQRMQASPDDWQEAYILLADQVDFASLDQKLQLQNATPDQRARTVMHQLLRLTQQSQTPLLQWLHQQPQMVDTKSITPYWISNLVVARLKPSAVLSLAQRQEVAELVWVAPIIGDSYTVNAEMTAPPVPAGHEPGHDAIHAPALWQMGYTGYGRKVLIIDSGVANTHPALSMQFWGNYAPTDQAWYHPNGSPTPLACDLHGTHVTGTVVGYDAQTQDTIGVAFGANWMASPAVSTNNGTDCTDPVVSVVGALQWALNPDGDTATTADMPDVINNSWSISAPAPGNECNSVFRTIFDALETAGIAAVFSAGNTGPGTSTITSPKNIVSSPVNTFCVGMVFGQSPGFPIVNGSSRGPALCGSLLDNQFKPEVVAPGANIRSTGPDGLFYALTGTSMATPHVSGALLLLKEAFPYLNGTELKYALYHSATDLGTPGEDNTFGMGLINVEAAFDSLVQQGHIPVVPNDVNDAALTRVLGLGSLLCDSVILPRLLIENKGSETIDSLLLVWEGLGNIDSLVWNGTLTVGATDTLLLPAMNVASGNYQLRFEIVKVNGLPDYHALDNRRTIDFVISTGVEADLHPVPAVCEGNEVLLAERNSQSLYWYDDPFSRTAIATGPTFMSPPLNLSTSYYVAPLLQLHTGKSDNNGDAGLYDEIGAWLWFSAEREFVLQSVLVYSAADGIRTVELRDKNGNLLDSKPLTVNFGPRRLVLDLAVPRGDSLRLGISSLAGSPQIFSANSGATYPYVVPGVLSIVGSSLGANAYPYYYDWEIVYGGCQTEIPVSVVPGQHSSDFAVMPSPVYLSAGGTAQFTDLSSSASSWWWLFGDGDSSALANPAHTYSSAGVYWVSLQTVGAAACSDVHQAEVEVVGWNTGLQEDVAKLALTIRPNPTDGKIWLEMAEPLTSDLHWQMLDAQGRVLQTGVWRSPSRGNKELDLSDLPTGIYALQLTGGGESVSAKIVRQ